MEIETGIPIPQREKTRGIIKHLRAYKENGRTHTWLAMRRGNSILFPTKRDAALFMAHICRVFGSGRTRSHTYENGTCRVWKTA